MLNKELGGYISTHFHTHHVLPEEYCNVPIWQGWVPVKTITRLWFFEAKCKLIELLSVNQGTLIFLVLSIQDLVYWSPQCLKIKLQFWTQLLNQGGFTEGLFCLLRKNVCCCFFFSLSGRFLNLTWLFVWVLAFPKMKSFPPLWGTFCIGEGHEYRPFHDLRSVTQAGRPR